MFVWLHLPTSLNRRLGLRIVGLILIFVVISTTFIFNHASAAADINRTIGFQGRLFDASGNVVPDGNYNMQFKIYQDGSGTAAGNPDGTLKWTETYITNSSPASGVKVRNGFFSVQLGSHNPFGSAVDWNQDTLWLSMNIAGSASNCTSFGSGTCVADGEMLPMKRMSATPYALNAGRLNGKEANDFIHNSSTQQAGNFNISGTGRAEVLQGNSSVLAPIFDRADSGLLQIGNTNATSIEIGTSATDKTISIGSGLANTNVTMGSSTGASLTMITAGTGGVTLNASNVVIDSQQLTNTGSTLNATLELPNRPTSGTVGTATETVDRYTSIAINQTTFGRTLSLPAPSTQTAGRLVYVLNTGTEPFMMHDTEVPSGQGQIYTWSGSAWRLAASGNSSGGSNTLQGAYDNGSVLTTTNGRNIAITIADTAVDADFITNIANGSTGRFRIQSNTADILSIGADGNLTVAGEIQGASAAFIGNITAASLDRATAGTLAIGNANATSIDIGTIGAAQTINIGTNSGIAQTLNIGTSTGAGTTNIRSGTGGMALHSANGITMNAGVDGIALTAATRVTTNSTSAFAVQTAGGSDVFKVDTSNMGVTVSGSIDQTGTRLTLKHALPGGSATPYPREMDIVGNYAYVVNQGDFGPLTIMDITNPGAPQVVSTLSDSLLYHARDIRVAGRYAYIVTLEDRLVVVDIANASSPSIVGSINSPYLNDAHGLEIQGNYVYAAAHSASGGGLLSVFNVSSPANPTYVSSVNNSSLSNAKQVDINGRYAYVTNGSLSPNGGLVVIDIANPKAPVMVGSILSSQLRGARDVVVSGKYAYVVSEEDDRLVILNISNPSSPTIVGSVTDPALDGAFALTLNGRYAYVGGRNSHSVQAIDISNPASPTLVSGAGYTATNLTPSTLMMKGRYLFVGSNRYSITESNFRVLDTSGATLNSTSTNTLDTESLQVHRNADITGILNVANSVVVGQGGIATNGALTVGGSATFRVGADSTEAFRVQSSNGSALFNADSTNKRLQIGSGAGTGTAVVITLDHATSAPSSAPYGSMYYDTTEGKVRCYEQDGWGACGAAPDTFVTLSPQFAGAVTGETGTGTLTSGICSDTLNINDGSSSQPSICGTNETSNFYRWTSTSASAQTRSIFVSYQLPSNFKSFVAGKTSLKGKTSSASSSVSYQVYRNATGGLSNCGSAVAVSTGAQTTWQTGLASGTADPANCDFAAGDIILIKIDMTTQDSNNAYVGNLTFTYSLN